MGIFKKTEKEILQAKIKKLMDSDHKEVENNPDKHAVVFFNQDFVVAKTVDISNSTPDKLFELGKLLSDRFSEEVETPTLKLYVDFCEKYDIVPFKVNTKTGTNHFIPFYSKLVGLKN